MSEDQPTKPKIIVDDDWKSRAQAEKEQLQREAEAKREPGVKTSDKASEAEDVAFPPASLATLVTSLATQALAMLGQIPDEEGKPMVHLDHAKHMIDTLAVLETKTKGNVTPDEAKMLDSVLHELRMIYVSISKQVAAASSTTKD